MPRKNIADVLNTRKNQPYGSVVFCIGSFGSVHTGTTRAEAAASAAASDDERCQGHRMVAAA